MALVDTMPEIKQLIEQDKDLENGTVHDVIVVVLAEDKFGQDASEVGSAAGAKQNVIKDIFLAVASQIGD